MIVNLDQDRHEIIGKIKAFQTDHAEQLSDFNKFYKSYRVKPTKNRKENQSNTVLPELFVEIEALATAAHEMIFSDNSEALFFDVVAQDEDMEQRVEAHLSKSVLAKQIELTETSKKMLPFLRMLCLQGTYPVSTPWVLSYKSYWDDTFRVRRPAFDCWDFQPFSILNFSFDDTVEELERAEWAAETMHVKRKAAMGMVKKGLWNESAVRKALDSGIKRNIYDREQRQIAGYLDTADSTAGFTAHEYYGTLESRDDDEIYRAVVTDDGEFLMEPEINPYAHGEKPWLVGQWFSLPGEPYGMGTGHINYRTQSEINDRRNFINDLLYSSLYSMWLKRVDSGINLPGGKMRWSPHQIIEGDQIGEEFLRALRPDVSPLGPAINLESNDIEKMRRNSGATSTLQAVATGITATESQQIQSEATRRIKAMIRSNLASLLRKFLYRAHSLNLQFLDRPFTTSVKDAAGLQLFGQVTRQDLIIEPDIRMKLTTDLDFRPFKRREMIELLDVFSRLEAGGQLGNRRIVPDPIIETLADTYGMDPRKFFAKEGLMEMETQRMTQDPNLQRKAMGEMVNGSEAAQVAAAQAAQQMGL